MRKTIVAVVVLFAGAASAALIDNYTSPRVGSVAISCGESGPCDVEINRVRDMIDAAKTEAAQLGIDANPIIVRTQKRRITRANLDTCIASMGNP
jgi:hypothetical protein